MNLNNLIELIWPLPTYPEPVHLTLEQLAELVNEPTPEWLIPTPKPAAVPMPEWLQAIRDEGKPSTAEPEPTPEWLKVPAKG